MRVNVSKVVSHPCTDDRITLPHPTVPTKDKLSRVEKCIKRTKNKLEDHTSNLSIVDLLFLHGGCVSMTFKVILRRNGKKGDKDAWKIRTLRSNPGVDVSKTRIHWLFLLGARIVCKKCLV